MQETFPAPESGTGFGENLDQATDAYSKALEVVHRQLSVSDNSITPWEQSRGAEIIPVIGGVFLGAKPNSNGIGSMYTDEYFQPVPEAGIEFGVEQASYGFTGISAKPLKGYKVEALNENKESHSLFWNSSDDISGRVIVTADWGKMSDIPIEQWATANLGKTGGQAGIVRVTGPDSQQKYFALGADFKGEPDKWSVKGDMVEITPHDMPSLLAQKLGLPSAVQQVALQSAEKSPVGDETPLNKAKRLYTNSTSGVDKYDFLVGNNPETDEAIDTLNETDRKGFNQWMVDRARSGR